MIVVAYFQYDTGRSDIKSFTNDDDAKNWLYEKWKFMLKKEISCDNILFEELCNELRYIDDCSGVVVEYLRL